MANRVHFTAVALTAASLSLGLLAGCGETSSTDRPGPAESGNAAEKPSGQKNGNGPGHNPASATDRRGRAPDDVIQNRPGGPKPPGAPQPQK